MGFEGRAADEEEEPWPETDEKCYISHIIFVIIFTIHRGIRSLMDQNSKSLIDANNPVIYFRRLWFYF